MEKFEISVSKGRQHHHFEVRDYMHHDGEQCKYEVYKHDQFVGSFEPDGFLGLRICKDPHVIHEDILHLIAHQLESYNL